MRASDILEFLGNFFQSVESSWTLGWSNWILFRGSDPFEVAELLVRAPELFEFLESLLQSLGQLQLPQCTAVDG